MPTPQKREETPFTQARLKSLIKVFCTFGGYQPDPNDPSNVPQLSELALVGSVTKVSVGTTRQAAERRELNFDTAGQIQEMIPGLESFDIKMTHIVLYRQSFMEACGFAGHELRYNTRPILFALQLPSPTPGTLPPKTLLLRDCWIKGNPFDFSVEEKDDLRIVQTVPIHVGGLREVK